MSVEKEAKHSGLRIIGPNCVGILRVKTFEELKEAKVNINVAVIGGGPTGIITALTAKSVYPEKSVCIIKDIGDGVIPCAIPYMMHTLKDPNQNAMGKMPLEKAGIVVIVGKVGSFDPKVHSVTLESGQALNYERLVLATGTEAVCLLLRGSKKMASSQFARACRQ